MKSSRFIANPLRLAAVLVLGGSFISAALATQPGRMTGGGSILCSDTGVGIFRVTHGFEMHCSTADFPNWGSNPPKPNTLEINFSGGDNFHLKNLDRAACAPPGTTRPNAPFSYMDGEGVGTFNQRPATIRFVLEDLAEPGAGVDTAYFKITDTASGLEVLNCGNFLEGGNHQAHRATGSKQ